MTEGADFGADKVAGFGGFLKYHEIKIRVRLADTVSSNSATVFGISETLALNVFHSEWIRLFRREDFPRSPDQHDWPDLPDTWG
jgi:hypothetical protein